MAGHSYTSYIFVFFLIACCAQTVFSNWCAISSDPIQQYGITPEEIRACCVTIEDDDQSCQFVTPDTPATYCNCLEELEYCLTYFGAVSGPNIRDNIPVCRAQNL